LPVLLASGVSESQTGDPVEKTLIKSGKAQPERAAKVKFLENKIQQLLSWQLTIDLPPSTHKNNALTSPG
jgi:hypothetical protein